MSKEIHGNSLYKEEYCQKMIDFFNVPHTKLDADGNEVANSLPTFEKFAFSIGVHRETLLNWTEKHQEFFDTYKKAKDLQKDMLIDLGMRGLYNSTFTIFTAKNITDMKDKTEVNQTVTEVPLIQEDI